MVHEENRRTEFLRATSHDFKEPINTIKFYLSELSRHHKVKSEHDLQKQVRELSRKATSLLTKFSNFYESYKKSNNTVKFFKEVDGPISRHIEDMEANWRELYPNVDYISFPDLDNLHISRLDIAFQRMASRLSGLLRYLSLSDRPEKTLTDVEREIRLVQNDLAAQFDREHIDFDAVSIVGSCSDRFDRVLLSVLFQNLISNSIKYRDRVRRLRMRISLFVVTGNTLFDGAKGMRGFVNSDVAELFNVFLVEDNARGIPRKSVEMVFRPYYQLERDISERDAGAGMGLAIVRSVVEIHNGKVLLESEEGVGSRFIIATKRRATLMQPPDDAVFLASVNRGLGSRW